MASGWRDEAERRARTLTEELTRAGVAPGAELTYQLREARFTLRVGAAVAYFAAHDYERRRGGMDWAGLRTDVLAQARRLAQGGEEGPPQG